MITTNGTNGTRPPFWQFNFGHAITITLLIFSAIGMYFKVDSRLSAVELVAASNSLRIERMDEQGTKKSQLGISQDTEMVRANTNRIAQLEQVISVMSPKIERIDVNVQWIMQQPRNDGRR